MNIKMTTKCKCGKEHTFTNRSNYNRALRRNGICNQCSRLGAKRTDIQRQRIREATMKAMENPLIIQKIKSRMSNPDVRKKMSENGTAQMKAMLNTDINKTLWSWKISYGTKKKWNLRPLEEKQRILTQIENGRKIFKEKLKNSKYKREHIRKILCSGKIKDTTPEKEVSAILSILNIKFIKQYQLQDKVYDFYIPLFNLLLEVDGVYWHGKNLNENQMNDMQKKHRKNDMQKNNLAYLYGYKLERIWEDEINITSVKERILKYGK